MVTATLTKPFVAPATSIVGDRVKNLEGEDLGKIEEIVLDMDFGTIAYAVLSFGGFMGVGNKLFAVPWKALKQSMEENEFVLHADRATLENAPGFAKNDWPKISDRSWRTTIYGHYKIEPYWS